jgi:hypothetical protein
MLNLTPLATSLKTSPFLLTEILETLAANGVEPTLENIEVVFLSYVKGKKGVKGSDAAMSYLAYLAAEKARGTAQPQLGLMDNMKTLERSLVSQFDPLTTKSADKVTAELIRNTVAKVAAGNIENMPESKALLNQLGNFTTNVSANFGEAISPDQSMELFLGATAKYQSKEASSSFLLKPSTTNLLTASTESVEQVEEAIA